MNQTVVCVILFLVRNVSTPAWGRAWVGLTAFRVNISENLGKTAVLTMITSLMYISTSLGARLLLKDFRKWSVVHA